MDLFDIAFILRFLVQIPNLYCRKEREEREGGREGGREGRREGRGQKGPKGKAKAKQKIRIRGGGRERRERKTAH